MLVNLQNYLIEFQIFLLNLFLFDFFSVILHQCEDVCMEQTWGRINEADRQCWFFHFTCPFELAMPSRADGLRLLRSSVQVEDAEADRFYSFYEKNTPSTLKKNLLRSKERCLKKLIKNSHSLFLRIWSIYVFLCVSHWIRIFNLALASQCKLWNSSGAKEESLEWKTFIV